ncbi:MFS transporter [Litorivicinus lipolyticus]|uniref:MFS transporter n=1 Tax=Litorivicinus lipolyticus TaxID=418701 RepID=A0A5Q2Q660_9GAMM|nr:MFS transporter [Litorivicinus lipolyticus]QGG79659.1 MFS transporter [Litorivicinus lipolyticus]
MKPDLARLVACQALLGSAMTVLVSITALASKPIAPGIAWITLPVSLQFIGLLMATTPASLLMARVGRRNGFMVGAALGAAAGGAGAWAMVYESFMALCIASTLAGAANAFGQYYRFAAQEVVPEPQRARALGWVMFGGVIAAFLGPQASIIGRDIMAVTFEGAYLAMGLMFVVSFVLLWGLKVGRADLPPKGGRDLAQLIRDPVLIVAVIAGVTSYSVMALLMNVTTLAMDRLGFEFGQVGIVIQWHVVAMFGPSFITGSLMTRFGTRPIMLVGALMYLGCSVLAQIGQSYLDFVLALVLLGAGWNFLFLGATRSVGEALAPSERARGQALNETLVFGFTALAVLFAAPLEGWLGWQSLNIVMLIPVAIVVALIALIRPRPQTA